jgi:acyl-CoA oxidase
VLGRTEVAPSMDESSLISRHEKGVLAELKRNLHGLMNIQHKMAAIVHPRAFRIIESIGHRMAVDAARLANVDNRLISIFEAYVVSCDSSWYSENGVTREEQARMQREAMDHAKPYIQDFISSLGMREYIQAPMTSNEKWDSYVSHLVRYEHQPGEVLEDTTDNHWIKAKL